MVPLLPFPDLGRNRFLALSVLNLLPYFFVLSGFSPRPGVALCGWCLESEIGPLNAPIPIVTKAGF